MFTLDLYMYVCLDNKNFSIPKTTMVVKINMYVIKEQVKSVSSSM